MYLHSDIVFVKVICSAGLFLLYSYAVRVYLCYAVIYRVGLHLLYSYAVRVCILGSRIGEEQEHYQYSPEESVGHV